MATEWYSAECRLVFVVEDQGAIDYRDIVVVFTSTDWKAALRRALEIGRSHESDFVNMEGNRAAYRLKEVSSLDLLGEHLDGIEVFTRDSWVPEDERVAFDTTFTPEDSQPVQARST